MILAASMLLSGCGGGGANTGGENTHPAKKSVVKISLAGTLPADMLIGGIDIIVSLASGVSVKSSSAPPETDAGAVVASGVAIANSLLFSTYAPAAGITPGKVHLLIANTSGFGIGEFATLIGDISAGSDPVSADFTGTSLTVTDVNGAPITGLAAALAVHNQ